MMSPSQRCVLVLKCVLVRKVCPGYKWACTCFREYFEDCYVMDASGIPRSYTAAW